VRISEALTLITRHRPLLVWPSNSSRGQRTIGELRVTGKVSLRPVPLCGLPCWPALPKIANLASLLIGLTSDPQFAALGIEGALWDG